jgi:hypothetical protein
MENPRHEAETPRRRSAARPEHPLIPAGRVNGTHVFSLSGEKLGKVEDVALDKVGGRVAYAILSFGGLLGMGESYYPVPWNKLRYDTERRGYVIPCDKATLEAAPSFEPEELSGWEDSHLRDRIFEYYNPYGFPPLP